MTERTNRSARVPRSLAIGSFLLSALFTLLVVWLLAFVLGDVGDLRGPDYDTVSAEYVDATLREEAVGLRREVAELETRVARRGEQQQDLRRSMDNARDTMQQMMELQRLSLERGAPPTETEREALATAQGRFLDAQEAFEIANAEIAASNETKFQRTRRLAEVEAEIAEQERPAREEWDRRRRSHEFRVATIQLAIVVPLFLLAAWAFARWRASAYRPVLLALLLATFWTLGRVMFEHFPREFFKYVAIAAAIAIVLAFLVWVLRKAARPSRDLLLTRYREAYRAHLCPVCAYPIARGPLRFASWTRKGPRVPPVDDVPDPETPWACPSCGTTLFDACRACEAPRHTLLPYCERCGDELAPAEA